MMLATLKIWLTSFFFYKNQLISCLFNTKQRQYGGLYRMADSLL